jgi:hypothetical protein
MTESQPNMPFGIPQAFLAPVFDWVVHVFSPLTMVRGCVAERLQEDVGKLLRTYWFFPILLTIVTDGIVLHFYGIELKSEPLFTLLYLTFAAIKLLIVAFILLGILRLMKVRTSQGLVFVCVTVITIYNPLFSWIGIPQSISMFTLLTILKTQHLGFEDTMKYMWNHAHSISLQTARPLQAMTPFLDVVSIIISLFSATLVAECLAQLLMLERRKAYVATAVASVLTLLPTMLFGTFQLMLIFAYLNGAGDAGP